MSDTLKIFGDTYTGVNGIKASDGNGTTYTYIRPAGSQTITTNNTYDVTALSQVIVNVASSSSGGLTLISTTSLGTLSTSSTSAADTGKSLSLASTTGWSNYDLLIVDCSVDTQTNGRHTSSVGFVILTGTSNVNTKNTYTVGGNVWNSKKSSSGTVSTRQ